MKEYNEDGAIMVLTAILAFALIMLVALAIDTAIITSSKTHRGHTAEFASLGALEAYIDAAADVDANGLPLGPAHQLNASVQRAKQLIGDNIPLMVGTSFLEDPANLQNEVSNSGGVNGRVIPGLWHFAEPDDCSTYATSPLSKNGCPCGFAIFEQCFEEVVPSVQANAIRINLHFQDGQNPSHLKTLFARVAGQDTINFSNSATASLIERHAVVLLDLSRSMYRDTHKFVLTSPSPIGAEYAHVFTNGSDDCTALNPITDLHDFPDVLGDIDRYNGLLDNRPPGDEVKTDHYKAASDGTPEFACQMISAGQSIFTGPNFSYPGSGIKLPEGDNAAPGDEFYYLDQVIPPEPLTGILDAIHIGMRTFSNRAVGGDLLGIIGFDDDILNSRFLPMTPPTRNVDTVPTNSGDPYVDFYASTDVMGLLTKDTKGGINNKTSQFLFPRTVGRYDKFAKSDLPMALNVAQEMLVNSPGFTKAVGGAQSMVIVISDGLSNCTKDKNVTNRCLNDEDHFNASMKEIKNIMAKSYVDNKIATHVLLIGEQVWPHTLLRKNTQASPNRCLTEAEVRITNNSWVNASVVGGTRYGGNRFFGANKWFNTAARDTGGMWAPIRPCCRAPGGECQSVVHKLDEACSMFDGPHKQRVTKLVNNTTTKYLDPKYHDEQARLFCDPEGRTREQQVEDYITDILSANPMVLVQEAY